MDERPQDQCARAALCTGARRDPAALGARPCRPQARQSLRDARSPAARARAARAGRSLAVACGRMGRSIGACRTRYGREAHRDIAQNRAILRPTSAEIAEMEAAFDWLRELRRVDSGMALVTSLWALCSARHRSLRKLCAKKQWAPLYILSQARQSARLSGGLAERAQRAGVLSRVAAVVPGAYLAGLQTPKNWPRPAGPRAGRTSQNRGLRHCSVPDSWRRAKPSD